MADEGVGGWGGACLGRATIVVPDVHRPGIAHFGDDVSSNRIPIPAHCLVNGRSILG